MEAQSGSELESGEFSKSYVSSLLWRMDRLVKPFLEPFGVRSEPTCVYQDDLEALKRRLARIKVTLRDYESRSAHTNDTREASHNLWLSELRDLECRSQDIIEVLEFEALRTTKLEHYKRELRSRHRMNNKRGREEHEFAIYSSSPPVKHLGNKIQELWRLFNGIAFDWNALRLREEDGEKLPSYCPRRPATTSFMSGAFHGRAEEVKEMIDLLISDEGSSEDNISVIPLCGMGGVGKTSLARRVYSDESVKSHFHPRIWISIAQALDAENVTKSIREALELDTCCPSEFDLLQRDVRSKLKERRFLLVVDDLWSDGGWERHWEAILSPLKVGAKGSKVIVTTRDLRVAKLIGTVQFRHLSWLRDDDCMRIFHQHAFGCSYTSADPNFARIGKEINQRCGGLPLAAKVLGCLLKNEQNEEYWENVLKDLWHCEEHGKDVLHDLRSSYDHLPMQLKRCFLYCSLFPKGYKFKKEQLSKLWMAQGFLETDGSSKLEEKGNKYFDELVERSFFQLCGLSKQQQQYAMHDLLDELAQSIDALRCKRTEHAVRPDIPKGTRHSSLILDESSHSEEGIQFEVADAQDLRTLLFIRRYEDIKTTFHFEIRRFLPLQCFRALDLSYTDIRELPPSIGHLIHLRYLGLRNTKIKRLPESICGLFKLQTLDLKQCHDLQQLPQGMNLLSDLQHLQLPAQCRMNDQTLSAVIEYDEPESEAGGLVECDATGNNFDGQLKTTEGISTAESKNESVNMLTQSGGPPSVSDRRNVMDENVPIADLMMCDEAGKVDNGQNTKKGTRTDGMLKAPKANTAYCSVSKAGIQNLESATEEQEEKAGNSYSQYVLQEYNKVCVAAMKRSSNEM